MNRKYIKIRSKFLINGVVYSIYLRDCRQILLLKLSKFKQIN